MGTGSSRNSVEQALWFVDEGFEYKRASQPHPRLSRHLGTLEARLEAEERLHDE